MTRFRTSSPSAALAAFLLIAGAGAAIPLPAYAQSAADKTAVDAAKARGQVGERGDGFIGFVTPSTDAALAASVAAINKGRETVYRDTAMKTNVTVDAAGQATAQQLFARLPAGQFFQPLNGAWTKK